MTKAEILPAALPFLLWGVVWIGLFGGETFSSRHTLTWVAWALPFLPMDRVAGVEFALRKALHFLAYGVLGWMAGREAARRRGAPLGMRSWLAATGLLGSVALLDEGHQQLVRGRHPSPVDVLLDLAGSAVGLTAAEIAARRRRSDRGDPDSA